MNDYNLDDPSLYELINEWMNQNRYSHLEGQRGIKALIGLIKVLGYSGRRNDSDTLIYFLEDNPGAIEALVEWISSLDLSEWKENLTEELKEENGND